jgi:O-antigen ligase
VLLAVSCVAWGALAFGAVYPWAYWPLAAAALSCGISGLAARPAMPAIPPPLVGRALVVSLAAVAAAILVQLLPLPLAAHARLSPAAASLLPDYDFAYGAGMLRYRALSIAPAATWTALALYASFAVLFLGLARLLALGAARQLAEGIAAFGAVMALIGIVQQPLYSGKIYGFWTPQSVGQPFGPFVNRNHFAGWMLMALPLALALLCAGIEHSMRGLKPGWRYRLLWLSSPDASRVLLLALACGVMALSLVLTMSRSGMSALALSLVLTGWFAARGLRGLSRKAAALAYVALLGVTVVGWIGTDTIVSRFTSTDWSEFNGRREAWSQAVALARRFPVAGTGLNTYDTLSTYSQRTEMVTRFGEAHNDYLQLAAEGGVWLSVPILVCFGAFVREVWRRRKDGPGSTSWWLRRGALTALVAIGLQEAVDFSLQMPGNAALFAVVCALAVHHGPPVRRR